MVVHVAVVERHVLLLQVDAVGDQALEHLALRAEELAEVGHRVLHVVDAVERVRACLPGDVVLERVDGVVELFQGRKGGVDQHVDDEVGEEGRQAFGQLGALLDPALKVVYLW